MPSGPEEQPKKKRNDGDTAVHGVSASQEFWQLVQKKMAETGMTRSKLIVDTCIAAWGLPESVKAKRPGHPRTKLRNG